MRAAPDGSGETKVIDGAGAPVNDLFALAHDGIYYRGIQARELRFFSYATGQSRIIAPAPKSSRLGLSVSPDSHWLIYTQLDSPPGSDLMLVENFH